MCTQLLVALGYLVMYIWSCAMQSRGPDMILRREQVAYTCLYANRSAAADRERPLARQRKRFLSVLYCFQLQLQGVGSAPCGKRHTAC